MRKTRCLIDWKIHCLLEIQKKFVKMLTKIMISMHMLTNTMMSMKMLTKMMMIFRVFGDELMVKIFFEGEREAGRGKDPPAEHGRSP